MSKNKDELNALKKEVENVNEKLHELTPEELEQVNGGISNTIPALQSQTPGVQVTTSGGRPGAEMTIRVRGCSSITGSNEPLIVVD